MIPVKNPFKTFFANFFRKLKSGQLAIDELSLFLIVFAFIIVFIVMLLNLHRFAFMAWLPLLIAYWRSFSKKKINRYKENQIFIKYFYPANSIAKNTYRGVMVKKEHTYFNCKKCIQQLRIPKKTGHVKVTCPKCNYSFVKKTIRGHLRSLKKKTT